MNKGKEVILIGTIPALKLIKDSQSWQGNQRGMTHKDKSKYTRKRKYKKNWE